VQKEAYFFKKPLVVLRSETEWTELIENGLAVLSKLDSDSVIEAIEKFEKREYPNVPDLFGDGFAAERICKTLIEGLK